MTSARLTPPGLVLGSTSRYRVELLHRLCPDFEQRAPGTDETALAGETPSARALRLAIANIYRPGSLTPTVMLSLGLGLALLVTVIELDGNLHRQFTAALPAKAPSFFFLDIQAADSDRFDAFVRDHAPASTL